ncbi:S49 family peptidase, partial [Microbacteriaceae bacterium K1510]|nr:S49 family peptidase [Microbacteriaceae bacterium K1510]
AAGMLDLVAEMGDLKKKKKVYAVAANMAASAAYAIGCTAHELYVSRQGMAGSIGVIAMHTSFARMLDQAGVDTTIIFAGDHKADGNAYQ